MAEVLVNFESKGDADVLEAIKKVSRHVGDLKRIAKTPIDLKIAKSSMAVDDFNRVKRTVLSAKDATKDWAKETEKLWREQQKLASAAERAARATKSVSMGGITGSLGGGGRGGGGGLFPLGNPMAAPDPKSFSTKAVDAMKRSLGEMGDSAKKAGFQLGFVSRIIAAMGVRALVREVFQLADAYTTLQNKLRITVGEDSLGFISKEIFKIAQDSRMSLESVATAFSRTTRSVKSLGKSQKEVLVFTDALSKAIAVGGSTSVEASNAMIQLSQGMGSGALRGDELRSVLEQLPVVAELIADKMGVPIAALRKLGSQGAITTDVIFDAISGKSEELTEKMKTMQLTVGQAWTMLKNQATMSSAAMQGVMNALANTIQFVTNHFEQFMTAILMLTSAGGMWAFIKLLQTAVEASTALKAVWVAHPILTAAAGIALVTAALAPLVAQLRASSDATATWGDVWASTYEVTKDKVLGEGIDDGIKTVDAAMIGLSEHTENWIMGLAKAADILSLIALPFKYLTARNTGEDVMTMYQDRARNIIDDVNEKAELKETKRLIEENKAILAEDMALDGGVSEEDRLMKEFDKEREALLAYAEILEKKDKKTGGKASGKSFAELMEDLNKNRDKASITGDLSANSIEARVANEWLDAVDKLEDKIANGLTPAQARMIEKTIEEKVVLEDMLKLREQIQQSMKDEQKAQVEAFVKEYEAYFKFKEEQEKIAGKEAKADRESTRFDSMQGIASSISPNFAIQQQVLELEKFNEFAKQNKLADWAKLSREKIDELKASMRWENTHFETFADQMNSIFGPGGTLVKGFADAAANAIVMSQSLGDLRKALVDVLNSVQKQAISSLIQLPLNLAMGALTNSLAGGAGPTSLGSSGVRQVGAAEAASWNLGSGSSPGFASGGYTGNMGVNDVAGVVHGQEFVLNADATRRMGKQNLEMINKGATPTSAGAAPVNVTVNNNAGVQVETNQLSPGQIEIMISKGIRDQTGRVIAGQINDPNSIVSRSIAKNVNTDRRRV